MIVAVGASCVACADIERALGVPRKCDTLEISAWKGTTVVVGDSLPLGASLETGAPGANSCAGGATDWSSGNTAVAVVRPSGTVVGISPGSATITAFTGHGKNDPRRSILITVVPR